MDSLRPHIVVPDEIPLEWVQPPFSPFLFLGHISYLTSLLSTINKEIKLEQLMPADTQRIVSQSEVLLFPLHKQSERERVCFPQSITIVFLHEL